MESPKTLTAEEAELLLCELLHKGKFEWTSPKTIRNYTIALLMLDAGLRVGEVVQMSISHLYFNHEPVTTITISADIAKNKTERTIPVSQRLGEALKKHAVYCRRPNDTHLDPLAFCRLWPYVHLTARQVERIIRSAAMKSLGRPVHPHVLRHTFASRLMRKTNIRVVQELLGHKHLTSTQVYTHPNSEDLKEAIDGLEEPKKRYALIGEVNGSPAGVPNRLDAPGTDGDVR